MRPTATRRPRPRPLDRATEGSERAGPEPPRGAAPGGARRRRARRRRASLRPALAAAQASDDEDLRDFLVEAIALEQVTVLAYSTAAERRGRRRPEAHAGASSATRSRRTPTRCAARSTSSASTRPRRPTRPPTRRSFDDVDGLDDEAAQRLTDLLEELDGLDRPRRAARLPARARGRAARLLLGDGPGLDSEDLSTTAPRSPAARPSTWSSSRRARRRAGRCGRDGGDRATARRSRRRVSDGPSRARRRPRARS